MVCDGGIQIEQTLQVCLVRSLFIHASQPSRDEQIGRRADTMEP